MKARAARTVQPGAEPDRGLVGPLRVSSALCPKTMKRIFITILIAQLVAIAAFLYFAHLSDIARGKDGIGDAIKADAFSEYAGISFYLEGALWISVIIFSLLKRMLSTKEAQLAIGAPPLVLVVGWGLLWFM